MQGKGSPREHLRCFSIRYADLGLILNPEELNSLSLASIGAGTSPLQEALITVQWWKGSLTGPECFNSDVSERKPCMLPMQNM